MLEREREREPAQWGETLMKHKRSLYINIKINIGIYVGIVPAVTMESSGNPLYIENDRVRGQCSLSNKF